MQVLNTRAKAELNLATLRHENGFRAGWVDSQNELTVIYRNRARREELDRFLRSDIGTLGSVFEDNPNLELAPGDTNGSIFEVVSRLEQGYNLVFETKRHQAIRCLNFWLLFRRESDSYCPVSLRPDNVDLNVDWIIRLARAWGTRMRAAHGRLSIDQDGRIVTIDGRWPDHQIKELFARSCEADQSNFPEIAPTVIDALRETVAVFEDWQLGQPLTGVRLFNRGTGYRTVRNGYKIEITPVETEEPVEEPSDD